ncbi:MAG: nucleotidyltransferase domain-containing protein [Candidatus Wallbacteria bacterium]|nr:nucleotidyltransferase domain-containing protein [Candidatus Wallbacteria bacterium]
MRGPLQQFDGRASGCEARGRERILDLAALRGAINVRLFGSVARGEDNATSDVDLPVVITRATQTTDRSMWNRENRLQGRRQL